MKEYEKYVLWLDYFNSELKRSEGRRIPLSSATKAPTLDELSEACRRAGVQAEPNHAKFPLSALKQSGYVSVPKNKPKQALISKIAKELTVVRGQALKRQTQSSSGQKRK
jgi:signal recognition particle subunit SRP19